MGGDSTSPEDAELEREIRAGRAFSLAEAIGRLAGPGTMKGASPVDLRLQARAAVELYVKERLPDPEGALRAVLIREVGESALLLDHLDRPLTALDGYLRLVLANEPQLRELVRQVDVEWGRVEGARPYFESEGRPPHPDDPYTVASVRAALTGLLAAVGTTAG